MTDPIFDLCLAGLAGATLTFGAVLGFALKHWLDVRKEKREQNRQGWEPIGEPSNDRS